jgi:hypothetical protein
MGVGEAICGHCPQAKLVLKFVLCFSDVGDKAPHQYCRRRVISEWHSDCV